MTRSKPQASSSLIQGLGSRIRKARERLGWTQQLAAQRLFMSTEGYARIERGSVSPSIETFALICKEMAISPNDLLQITKPLDPPTQPPEHIEAITRITARLHALDAQALRFVDHAVRFALQTDRVNNEEDRERDSVRPHKGTPQP